MQEAAIADVLASLRSKGVQLWAENGQLRYRAPKGVLTSLETERLRLSRNLLLAVLQQAPHAEAVPCEVRSRRLRAPLGFAQLMHWNLYDLANRPAIRQIATATRLRGVLKVDALQRSISQLVRREDVLRTRVVVEDGVPLQCIDTSDRLQLTFSDLTALPGGQCEEDLIRRIDDFILAPIDISKDPLIGVLLIKLHDDEHVLVVAMEHMISDEASGRILLQEILAAYGQAIGGHVPSLPGTAMRLIDYAAWQRNAESDWLAARGAQWIEGLKDCHRARFPADSRPLATRRGWGRVGVAIEGNLRDILSEACRRTRTTLAMSVFAAYAACVLRWSKAAESVFLYQSDGRGRPELERAIGYFASNLYMRIELRENDRFTDLIERATCEYCRAYEHSDFSCMLTAQVPRLEFTRNAGFNWIAQESMRRDRAIGQPETVIDASAIPFVHPMLKNLHPMLKDMEGDNEPAVLLYDSGGRVQGDIYFPLNRFSNQTMENFAADFVSLVRRMAEHPEGRVGDFKIQS
jgi:hypothetical protein